MDDLRTKLSGSKYVQSRIGDSYTQAKAFLQQGRRVLFSGTPCQIAGLRNYLRKDYPNLITVDIICHGVPSPMLFEDYKAYMSQQMGGPLAEVKFRCKKSSWIFFNMRLTAHVEKNQPKEYIGCYYEDPYMMGFLRDNFLRPCCYNCQYTSTSRVSDFTIADWWGYRKQSKEDKGFRYKGVSLLFAHTSKAEHLLTSIKMHLRERTLEEAMKTNRCLSRSYPLPKEREIFWQDYHKLPFPEMVHKYMHPERVGLDKYLLQHYLNTDNFVRMTSLLTLPRRALRKAVKVAKIIINYK